MTNYTFPRIENFSDVEPFITDDFIVKTKHGVTYINYKHIGPDVFPPVTDLRTATMRELRGIAFDAETGKILSRPFHKFFNIGEREDEGNLTEGSHRIEEKLDGSLVRPIPNKESGFRLATKAGITDIAMKAEVFIADKPDVIEEIQGYVDAGITPLYEYVGPHNKVVLDYPEGLHCIGYRANISGEYLFPDKTSYLHTNTSLLDSPDGVEGIVVVDENGHRQKWKTEWYVERHKAKDLFSNERKFVQILLDDALDDVLPMLSVEDKKKALKLSSTFWYLMKVEGVVVQALYELVRHTFKTKKEYALSGETVYRSHIFALWDGKAENGEGALVSSLKKNLSTGDRYHKWKEVHAIDWSVEC